MMARSLYFLLILILFGITFVVVESAADHNYKEALTNSILFFEGQRSGKLPPAQRMTWRGDSALTDGQAAGPGVDLIGGYYDAGDNVKFSLPMAFTTTMLSWSVVEFGGLMGGDELMHAREAIRWGTDYLLKCASEVKSENKMYGVVGDPNQDHNNWERPEDMDTPRSVYSVTAGSDLAGETAAALAAASMVFRKVDTRYTKLLRRTADDVMQFALNCKGKYSDQLGNAASFYCSSGYNDELLWGAAWLYKATKDPKYHDYLMSSLENEDTDIFSWDNKFAGANVLLAREYLVGNNKDFEGFNGRAVTFMCKILPSSQSMSVKYTPGGLLYRLGESPLQYTTSMTFLMTAYAKYLASRSTRSHNFYCGTQLFTPKSLRIQAKTQVDYILGNNPMKMSYMVGYGAQYPKRVHHRGSSLPSIKDHPGKIIDGFSYLHASDPNPNILTGAITGGPDDQDNYADGREVYSQSEPATYINAPAVGIFAYFSGRIKQ